MSQGPLLLVSVNPDPEFTPLAISIDFRTVSFSQVRGRIWDSDRQDVPEVAAVYVAHVPVVYHVPALIRHPLFEPLV